MKFLKFLIDYSFAVIMHSLPTTLINVTNDLVSSGVVSKNLNSYSILSF
jgi:hypothetical protein